MAVELDSRPEPAGLTGEPATDRAGSRFGRRGRSSPRATPPSFGTQAKPPLSTVVVVRVVLAALLTGFVLITAAGALLLLMAWRQDATQGIATGQTERLWEIWDLLAEIERYVALAAVPLAVLWVLLAGCNVIRSAGKARWAPSAAVVLGVALFGIWAAGDRLVRPAEDSLGEAIGIAVQAACVIVAMLCVDRLAHAADARRRPLHMTAVMAIGYLVVLQVTGAISTIGPATDFDGWQRGATYVLIATLIQLLGALAANEAMRAIEEGTEHRFELRARFGEAAG